ncbi:MAG: hypothetical protein EOM20_17625 [Spartobacteria bacterium]|nr:hypothetical protein [Spartobacteria bacterium]
MSHNQPSLQLQERLEQLSMLMDAVPIQMWFLSDIDTYGRVNQYHAEFIESQNTKHFLTIMIDITERVNAEDERQKTIQELQSALQEVKTLRGIVPICIQCKKIRDDKGYWEHVESYVAHHTEAQFSHGICPDCRKKLYPELCDDEEK